MKKSLSLAFLFLGLMFMQAQEKDWSIEINYPFSVGDAFGSSNQGTIGVGVKHRFATAGKFRLGVSLDASWFATTFINDTDPIQELKYRDNFWQPRIFAELPLSQDNKLRLSGGIGWTLLRSVGGLAFFDEQGQIQGGAEWNSGLNMNIGLSYEVSSRWFVQTQYDFIYFSQANSPNRLVGLIKLGAGFRF